MWKELKKELKEYFLSPIGYIFVGSFLVMCSIYFNRTTKEVGATNFEFMFFYAAQILIFTIPILTMKMFGKEKDQEQPATFTNKIGETLGKYLSAIIVILITEIFTLIYFGILNIFKVPDIQVTIVTLLGFLLLSMAYISFGMFISSITKNKIIALTITIAVFVLIAILENTIVILGNISLLKKFYPFTIGVLPIKEIISLLSFSALFIALTTIINRKKIVKQEVE